MDVNELIKILSTKDAQLSAKDAQIAQLLEQMKNLQSSFDNMQARLDNLLRILYGQKSEKQKQGSNKLADNATDKTSSHKRNDTNGKPVRKKLPANLPRTDIHYELTSAELACDLCSNTCHKIGEEISEQLEIIPTKMFVKKHIRFKYACKNGCCVKVAPMPAQPIPKGIPGPGLLAEVAINKYQDSLPIYRQAQRFERHGIDIAESTLGDWMSQSAQLLSRLVDLMHTDMLRESHLYGDDTPVPVLAVGKTKKCRLWCYVSDHNNTFPCTIYDYSSTRAQTVPHKFLAG